MLAVIVVLVVIAILAKNRWRKAAQISLAAIVIFYAVSFSIGVATLQVKLTPVKSTSVIRGTFKTTVTGTQHTSTAATQRTVTTAANNVLTTAANNVVTTVATATALP